jgi:hypothetical protein
MPDYKDTKKPVTIKARVKATESGEQTSRDENAWQTAVKTQARGSNGLLYSKPTNNNKANR